MSYVDDPVHWRNRARSLRKAAEETTDAHARAMILELAEGYEQRAGAAEARAKGARANYKVAEAIEAGAQARRTSDKLAEAIEARAKAVPADAEVTEPAEVSAEAALSGDKATDAAEVPANNVHLITLPIDSGPKRRKRPKKV